MKNAKSAEWPALEILKSFPLLPEKDGISDDTYSTNIKQEKRMDGLPGHGNTWRSFFRVHGLYVDDKLA